MAATVKNPTESPSAQPAAPLGLAVSGAIGAAYIVGALAIVLFAIPHLWKTGVSGLLASLPFINTFGQLAVQIIAAGLLFMFALTLQGPNATPGIRAATFTWLAGVLTVFLLTCGLGKWFESIMPSPIAMGLTLAIPASVVALAWRFLRGSAFDDAMRAFEGQGWFHGAGFKPAQGKRVRRATLLGILIVVGCGIITLINHRTLDTVGGDLSVIVPFTGGKTVTLLPDAAMTLPLVLAAAGLWVAYRAVNMPMFAEFLIATDAELNKVSWPTKKNLVQDTIVVLTTVAILTTFLFVVDVAWGKILSSRFVGVLQLPEAKTKTDAGKSYEDLDW